MRRLYQLILNNNLRIKIVILYFVMILIPFSVITIVGGSTYVNISSRTAMTHTDQMINQVNNHMDFYIENIEKLTYYISNEESTQNFLQNRNIKDGDASLLDIQAVINNFSITHPEIAGIMIVSRYDKVVSVGMSRLTREPLTNEEWYKKAIQQDGNIELLSNPIGRNIQTDENYSTVDVFSLVKAVKDPSTGRNIGVILFDIKQDIIKESIKDITFGNKGFLFVCDKSGNIVYSPVNRVVYRVNPKWLTDESPDQRFREYKLLDEKYQIIFKDSTYTKWKVVGVFSLDEIMEPVTQLNLIIELICIMLAVLCLVFSVIIASSITRPLTVLRKLMKLAEEGDMEVHVNNPKKDEIGQLGISFNKMIDEIKKLIDLVYAEQQSKREAELKTLQAQIKPHFLYNTLDTIGWLAREHNAEDIVGLVGALTNLFRISLSDGQEIITLKEEEEHIRCYLFIQKARYKEKLNYKINIPKEFNKYRVPKLILQPVVENAIYHGIKAKRGNGFLQISASKIGEKIEFCIKDDGAGMTKQRLKTIREMLVLGNEEEKVGYGVFNVNERIKLSFGEEYGITIDSVLSEGTTVKVTIPIIN